MEHFYESIQGWFDFQEIYKRMVNVAPDHAHFVEVGSHNGRSAAFMAVEIANSGKKIQFDCIDPWSSELFYINNLEQFLENMKPANGYFNAIQGKSPDAASRYADNSLDFVFIDADHTYHAVKADIEAFMPKIKSGGYIAGHDYNSPGADLNIFDACNELLPGHETYNGEFAISFLWQKP